MGNAAAAKMTEHSRSPRDYECMVKYGGCGQTYKDVKAPHAVHETQCPYCTSLGMEKVWDDALKKKVYRIQIIHPDGPPRFTPDISGQDGRTNEAVDMQATLGEGQHISSRSTMKDALKRAREEAYESTRGEHSHMVPHQKDPDDPNSPVVWEKETSEHAGFDPGELHPVESINETANRPRSSFDEGKSVAEVDKDLEAKVGPEDMGFEDLSGEEIEKTSNEVFERALKR